MWLPKVKLRLMYQQPMIAEEASVVEHDVRVL
jgi:hypothetical protein